MPGQKQATFAKKALICVLVVMLIAGLEPIYLI